MRRPLAPALAAALVTALALPGRAANVLHETFDTRACEDGFNSTAYWDTARGRLSLIPAEYAQVGAYNTAGTALDVKLFGTLAFVADGSSGLQAINVVNPAAPVLLGGYDTPGNARGVALARDLAYVADGPGGLLLLKTTTPGAPSPLGTYPLADARGVAMTANTRTACVAAGAAGLVILNTTNTAAPALLATVGTPAPANAVVLSGNTACVACGAAGVVLVDISNPAVPAVLATRDTPGAALGVALSGSVLLVADDTAGLTLVNIATPAAPSLLATFDTPGNASGVTAAGYLALVADGGAGVHVVDIHDPAAPVDAGSYDTTGDARAVAWLAGVACVADGAPGLVDVEISRRVSPVTACGHLASPSQYSGLAREGNLLAVGALGDGVDLVDITNPAAPVRLGNYNTPDFTWGVAMAGRRVYAADDLTGLVVIDATNPTAPTLVGSYNTPGSARGVAFFGGHYCAVADFTSGILLLDVAGATPVLVGTYDTPGLATAVVVENNLAFVADGVTGLLVLNVSNPAAPFLVGSCNTPGSAWSVAVSGQRAAMADGSSGVQLIDISNPAAPVIVGNHVVSGEDVLGVALEGTLLVTAEGSQGARVLDISNPALPAPLATFDVAFDNAYFPLLAGEMLFLVHTNITGLHAIGLLTHDVDPITGFTQSLPCGGNGTDISRFRVLTTQTTGVTLELSADGGAHLQAITPGPAWSTPAFGGQLPLWRATLNWSTPGLNPNVSDLRLEWLSPPPSIMTVRDIPNDQGRQVRVGWRRSVHDEAGDAQPVTGYAVYRRIDDNLAAAAVAARLAALPADPVLRQATEEMLAAGWDYLVTAPALTEDDYSVVVPTLADSTIVSGPYRSVFRVTALTAAPGIFWHSLPDSGFSADNLAPAVPTNLAVAYHTGPGNYLTWNEAPVADLDHFNVYRSTNPAAPPSPGTLVASGVAQNWLDTAFNGGAVYYLVTAVDRNGNESAAASPVSVSGVAESGAPTGGLVLRANWPNPFRSATRLEFELPEAGPATLALFDISGRHIRTLLSQALPAGSHAVEWDGRDASGRAAPAGVYLYRLDAVGHRLTRRLLKLR